MAQVILISLFSFFIHGLYYFMNIEFICPSGKLIQKTFEIKRRSHGVAQVFLFFIFIFLFITYVFLLSVFICPSGKLIQKTFEIKRRSHGMAQVIQLNKLFP